MNTKILLDVHMEDLTDILSDMGWNTKTVTKELGSSQDARSDDNIIKYAQETNCVTVTDDYGLVQRLKAAGLDVITMDSIDRANIVDNKLRKKSI